MGLLVPMAFSSHPRCCSFQIHEKRTPRPAELVEIRGQNVGFVGRTAYEQPMWRSGGSIWIAHDSPYDPPCLGISWGNRQDSLDTPCILRWAIREAHHGAARRIRRPGRVGDRHMNQQKVTESQTYITFRYFQICLDTLRL